MTLMILLLQVGLGVTVISPLQRDAPVPVVLVPGWSDGPHELLPLQRRFLEAGWAGERISVLVFGDPAGSNVVHARALARRVDALREATAAGEVDVVAHSMGGLAVRHYLRFMGGADAVRRVAFLATPHRGTWAAHLAWGDGGDEMEPGSPFLAALNRGDPLPDGVEAVTVRTPIDLRVLPPSSATLPDVRDVEVCCPTHAGLVDDDGTFAVVRRFLAASAEELERRDGAGGREPRTEGRR